eukprot:gene26978-biopygen17552
MPIPREDDSGREHPPRDM